MIVRIGTTATREDTIATEGIPEGSTAMIADKSQGPVLGINGEHIVIGSTDRHITNPLPNRQGAWMYVQDLTQLEAMQLGYLNDR